MVVQVTLEMHNFTWMRSTKLKIQWYIINFYRPYNHTTNQPTNRPTQPAPTESVQIRYLCHTIQNVSYKMAFQFVEHSETFHQISNWNSLVSPFAIRSYQLMSTTKFRFVSITMHTILCMWWTGKWWINSVSLLNYLTLFVFLSLLFLSLSLLSLPFLSRSLAHSL